MFCSTRMVRSTTEGTNRGRKTTAMVAMTAGRGEGRGDGHGHVSSAEGHTPARAAGVAHARGSFRSGPAHAGPHGAHCHAVCVCAPAQQCGSRLAMAQPAERLPMKHSRYVHTP